MTNLTDKWKKGELKDGYYYVRDVTYILPAKLGQYDNQFYFSGNEVGYGYEENTELEVLSPVPTFEEWQASEKYNKHLEDVIKIYERKDKQATETSIAYNELRKENARLKEIIEKDKKTFAESRIYPAHLISEDFPVKYDIDKLKELLKECKDTMNKAGYLFAKIDDVKKAKRLLKQNNLRVARGFAEDKETALTEMFRYADQYSEEDFDKMIITLEHDKI